MTTTEFKGGYELSGNTYSCRDEIKALGGKWDAERKVWLVPRGGTMRERERVNSTVYSLRKSGVRVSDIR